MSYSFGPTHTSLRAWVRERFTPLVMVVASDSVESVCREKNGLSFVDLLRPFGEQTDVNAPLRISGQSMRVTEARMRFSYGHTMEQPTAEIIDAHLKNTVQKISEETIKEAPHRLSETSHLKSTPWFLKYRQDFLRLLCFDVNETYDHPLGCIYAISSAEVDSIKAFEDLTDSANIPTLMLQEQMAPVSDDHCGKLFVIVHDGSREGQTGLELAREKVRIVQKEYGHENCVLLLINTSGGKAELRGTPPISFDDLRPTAVPGGGAGEHDSDVERPKDGWGSFLSKADLERVNDLIRNYMTRCFFPKLDVRIGYLRAAVASKRRGFAMKFMERTSSLLKTSLSTIGRDHHGNIGFKYYSDEAQMRQLGDILFLLGRYEDALEAYNSISVSKEACPTFYAGLQFMMGLGTAVLVGFSDPSVYFNRAYDYYTRVRGKTTRMFATRTAMIHAAYCLTEGYIPQAIQTLLKGYESEEMLRGALLLEEASGLLLRTEPPSLRKFAFHMTLAGVRFYNCLFHKHSLRCYNLILDIYTNKSWMAIEQHVASMMLKFHREQGNHADAFAWTINMLTTQHALSPEIQKEYIEWICTYIKEAPQHEVSSIAEFSLPVLHMETMDVQFDGEVVNSTTMAEETDSALWVDLESRFRDPLSASTTTGLALTNNSPSEEPSRWVVCGEAVRFSCAFENPLQTPIHVTSAQLLFEFERTDDSCSPTSSPVSVPERNFSLKESERSTLELQLIPNTPGRLRIIGVSWFLNGRIPGHKLFGKASWQGKDRLPFRARTHYPTLLFVALDPVARFRLATAPVPHQVWKGQLWTSTWVFENIGKISIRNVQITSSCSDVTFTTPVKTGSDEELFKKHRVYYMDGDVSKDMRLNVCFNPQTAGRLAVHTVIRYESLQPETLLRARFLRHSFVVDVHEVLRFASWLLPSEMSRSFVLAMELENRSSDVLFDITAIEAVPNRYRVLAAGHTKKDSPMKLLPGQKMMQHALVTETDAEATPLLPNGTASVDRPTSSTSEEDEIRPASRQTVTDDDLAISLRWQTAEHSNSVSIKEGAAEGRSAHDSRVGCLRSIHDVTALSAKVDLHVDQRRMVQTMQNGAPVSFPISIRLGNICHKTLSVLFRAGDDWIGDENGGWKQNVKADKEDEHEQQAGLMPIASWSWSGQTECNIAQLPPAGSQELQTEIICFFPGSFCVTNYSCKWKSLENPMLSGIIPGKPLYLTVIESEPSKEGSVVAKS